MTELKPCPFCGGEARILNYEYDCEQPYYVDCPGCTYSADYETEEKAIAAWNTRAEPEPRALTVEELREMDGIEPRPVFVMWRHEETECFAQDHWYICGDNYQGVLDCANDGHLFEDYGKTWLAYDRQPKGE